ncbi:MAG: hypothetical protein ACFFC6_16270 [Promethearchaeota archaeon]
MSTDTFKLYQDAFVLGASMQRGNFEPAAHLMVSILTRLGVRSNIDVKTIFQPPNPAGNVATIFKKAGHGNLNGIINSGFTTSKLGNAALILAVIEQEEPRHPLEQIFDAIINDLMSPQITITINWFFQYPLKDHLLRERDAILDETAKLKESKKANKQRISQLGFQLTAFSSIILETINLGLFLSPENLIRDLIARVETRARITSLIKIGILPAILVIAAAISIPFLAEPLLTSNLVTETTLSYVALVFGSFLLPITKILYDRSSHNQIIKEVGNRVSNLGFEQVFRETFDQLKNEGKSSEVAATTAHGIANEFLVNFLIGKESELTSKQLEAMRRNFAIQSEQRFQVNQPKE